MPKKFIECVKKVKKENKKRYGYQKYNPYAVCRKATGYYGTTHEIGMVNKKKKHNSKPKRKYSKLSPRGVHGLLGNVKTYKIRIRMLR